MSDLSKTEPLVVRTAVVGVLTALLHAAVLLGWLPVQEDQEGGLAGVIDAIGLAVAVFWSRRAVTPVTSSEEVIQAAPEEVYTPRHAEGDAAV